MKLVNKSPKVVFVGTQLLMPDASIEVNEEIVKTPGVQALINSDPAVLDVDSSTEKAAEAKAKKEAAAKKKAEKAAKAAKAAEAESAE